MTEPIRDPLLMQIHGVVVREWGSEKPMQLALPLRDFFNAWLREQLSRPDIIEAAAAKYEENGWRGGRWERLAESEQDECRIDMATALAEVVRVLNTDTDAKEPRP